MENQQETLVHQIDNTEGKNSGIPVSFFLIIVTAAVVLGVLSGFTLSKLQASKTSSNTGGKTTSNAKVKESVGIADKKTFKDNAEGILREGGIDGEGNFHLERPGGISQNVYLTSTTVDLSQHIGRKVRVWGETFNAEKAGWLMDVGLVEILQ